MNEYRWADLKPGLHDSFTVTLTSDMMAAFRTISGDANPLHVDRDEAARRGFPDVVAFGLLIAGFYSRLVGVHIPGRYCLLQDIAVNFVAPGFPGDQLVVSGEIVHLSDAVRRAEIRATIHRGDQVLSRAKIGVGIAE